MNIVAEISIKKSYIDCVKAIHNNTYDYSKLEDCFEEDDTIEVICPGHGPFEVVAREHLYGKGCVKCVDVDKEEQLVCGNEVHEENIIGINDLSKIINIDTNAIIFKGTVSSEERKKLTVIKWTKINMDIMNAFLRFNNIEVNIPNVNDANKRWGVINQTRMFVEKKSKEEQKNIAIIFNMLQKRHDEITKLEPNYRKSSEIFLKRKLTELKSYGLNTWYGGVNDVRAFARKVFTIAKLGYQIPETEKEINDIILDNKKDNAFLEFSEKSKSSTGYCGFKKELLELINQGEESLFLNMKDIRRFFTDFNSSTSIQVLKKEFKDAVEYINSVNDFNTSYTFIKSNSKKHLGVELTKELVKDKIYVSYDDVIKTLKYDLNERGEHGGIVYRSNNGLDRDIFVASNGISLFDKFINKNGNTCYVLNKMFHLTTFCDETINNNNFDTSIVYHSNNYFLSMIISNKNFNLVFEEKNGYYYLNQNESTYGDLNDWISRINPNVYKTTKFCKFGNSC